MVRKTSHPVLTHVERIAAEIVQVGRERKVDASLTVSALVSYLRALPEALLSAQGDRKFVTEMHVGGFDDNAWYLVSTRAAGAIFLRFGAANGFELVSYSQRALDLCRTDAAVGKSLTERFGPPLWQAAVEDLYAEGRKPRSPSAPHK
jgi:hypothetical protein